MTRQETKALLGVIVTAYPEWKLPTEERALNRLTDLWAAQFANDSAEDVTMALNAHINISHFPPHISNIREQLVKLKASASGDMTAGEAWAKVNQSFKRYGYYNPTGAREFLGERIWRVVCMTCVDYPTMCISEDQNIPARFERLYKEMAGKELYQAQMPLQVQEHLKALGAGQAFRQIGGQNGT